MLNGHGRGTLGVDPGAVDKCNLPEDIFTGDLSNPYGFILYPGNLYFRTNNGLNGEELWVYKRDDVPSVVADINSAGHGCQSNFIVYQP